jgi:hypothetical protein
MNLYNNFLDRIRNFGYKCLVNNLLTFLENKNVHPSNRPDPLTDLEILEISRRYLTSGQIVYKQHFKERMDQRNISLQDVINAVENGKITKRPEWNNTYHEYNYFITGEDIEGVELTLKVAISTKDEMLIFLTPY